MKKTIYRKLKDYIYVGEYCTTTIFGSLLSTNVEWCWEDDNNVWHEWSCSGVYSKEMDFLLEYYVVGIHPYYKIQNDCIKPYLRITLSKRKNEVLLWD